MSNKEVFTYLKLHSTDSFVINRLIVSAFLYSRKIEKVNNKNINKLFVKKGDSDFEALQEFLAIESVTSFEQLIELFEFVISPKDKIVNGAVYTPEYIREYIIEQTLLDRNDVENLTVCDPACGCAGFLYNVAKQIKQRSGLSYADIFANNIYGLDIEKYSIERSEIILSLLAITEGEDKSVFNFNLFRGNALDFNWSGSIEGFEGFSIVLGNPPYVCSRNMDQVTLDLMPNWSVTQSGHPDLYIPFFQIGYELLSNDGILGFITVNTFTKSINGRALRQYFSENNVSLKIINFGGEQVFKDRNTYTCLCFMTTETGQVSYTKSLSTAIQELNDDDFMAFDYSELNHQDGWSLVNSEEQLAYIQQVESVGHHFKEKFMTRNGIATLKNNIYKFVPIQKDENFYTLQTKEGTTYQIEQGICRDIVNANKVASEKDLVNNNEKIIFPYYGNDQLIIKEEVFQRDYPNAYQYLSDYKHVLATRDKGNRKYEAWYAYGRRQSLENYAYKLFFPHISERATFTISTDQDLLFYNGIAVVSESLRELLVLKKILESDVFFDYIRNNTKDYSSGYISMSRNYIKNFGICDLTAEQENELLAIDNPERMLRRLYGLDNRNNYDLEDRLLTHAAEPEEDTYITRTN